MHVATVQLEAGPDPAANLEGGVECVRAAADRGADLVVLPELWRVGYFEFEAYDEHAEPLDGPTVTRLRELAAELDVHLHTGSLLERDDGNIHNTSGLVGPDGELLATYRKLHLFGYDSEESRRLTPGERVVSVETDLGTFGLATCYDLRFPELFRQLAEDDVELVLVTSAWPAVRLEHWRLLTRVRALENQCFLAAANLTGTNAGVTLAGRSVVVDPWGVVRADAGREAGVTLASVDLGQVADVRAEFPAFADRRLPLDR